MAPVATILVVEDERDIRDLLRRYLERAEFSVLTSGTDAEALTYLASASPDLVLLDLLLPDIDGFAVLSEPIALAVPLIALTARSSSEDRIRGPERGADDDVTKPSSPREVVLRVGAVLGRHSARTNETRDPFGSGRLLVDEARHEAAIDGHRL
jgi:DNA-binding response OmpR family regulator